MNIHSFDVFDTLLTRRAAVPYDLFQILSKELNALGISRSNTPCFLKERINAEMAARKKVPGGEPMLNEIYSILTPRCQWTQAQADQVMALELNLESRNLQAVPGMVQVVKKSRSEGFRILFLSDMYLPTAFLTALLRREGFLDEGEEVWVSGDTRAAKHNGTLFELVRSRNPDIEEWRHTGDHPLADQSVPASLGIKTVPMTRCHLSSHERWVRGTTLSTPLWQSQLAAAMRLARLAGYDQPEQRQPIWECAANVVGPLWFAFAEWCLDEAQRRGIKRLYFVARDGQIFHKVSTEIALSRGSQVDCRYHYGSRQAWHLPGLRELDKSAIAWIFNRQRYLTTEQVFKRVGLAPDRFRRDLEGLGLDSSAWTRDLSPEQESALRLLIITPRLRSAILEQAGHARTLAVHYMEQEGFFDGTPFAVVDIGWHGNMQRSLGNLLRSHPARKDQKLTGFYFGLKQKLSPETLDELVSYWPEQGPENRALQQLHLGLPEMMAAADHGTVLGFSQRQSRVEPVLDGERNQAALDWGLDCLQAGVLEFAKIWLGFEPLPPGEKKDFQGLTRKLLVQFISEPTLGEAAAWAGFPHSGEQIERHKEGIAPELSMREAFTLIRKSEQRPGGWWAEGSLARRYSAVLDLYLRAKMWKRRVVQRKIK